MQKISFTTLSTPGLGVREAAGLARRFGYDGVDIRVSRRAGELLPDAGREDIAAVRAILDGEGVEAAGLMCYTEYPELPPAALTASLKSQTLRQIAVAQELGARSVRIGGGRSESRAYYEELRDALADVLPQAGDVDVVIQNHSDAFTAGECLALVKELNHPRFTLAFSPDHCVLMGEDFNAVLPELAGRVAKLFVADLKMQDGSHETVLPGQGCVPLADCYEAIGGPAFHGWITFKYEKFWDTGLLGPEESLPYFAGRAPGWFSGWKRG